MGFHGSLISVTGRVWAHDELDAPPGHQPFLWLQREFNTLMAALGNEWLHFQASQLSNVQPSEMQCLHYPEHLGKTRAFSRTVPPHESQCLLSLFCMLFNSLSPLPERISPSLDGPGWQVLWHCSFHRCQFSATWSHDKIGVGDHKVFWKLNAKTLEPVCSLSPDNPIGIDPNLQPLSAPTASTPVPPMHYLFPNGFPGPWLVCPKVKPNRLQVGSLDIGFIQVLVSADRKPG